MLGVCWNWGSTSTNNGLRVWGPRTWNMNSLFPSRFSPLHVDTSTGMSTKNQPTSDGLRICSSFALMMISARQKSQKSNSWETQTVFFEPAVLSATILKQIFWARTAACNLFLYPLGFAGSSRCKWFIMILESSHRVNSCILKARSQEAHYMTHWTVGIWGRYASVANDGSNLPYSHLLGYAPAGNA